MKALDSNLRKELEMVKKDDDVAKLGFKCLGRIDNVYPDLPKHVLQLERTWIWINPEGVRVAMWDQGNTYCQFLCEGTEEALIHYANL